MPLSLNLIFLFVGLACILLLKDCLSTQPMINVTVIPITDTNAKPGTPIVRIMSERLIGFAADLEIHFQKRFSDEKYGEELVVYIGYNSNYAVRWKIMSDVSEYIQDEVARRCGSLGYIFWRELDPYSFRPNKRY